MKNVGPETFCPYLNPVFPSLISLGQHTIKQLFLLRQNCKSSLTLCPFHYQLGLYFHRLPLDTIVLTVQSSSIFTRTDKKKRKWTIA